MNRLRVTRQARDDLIQLWADVAIHSEAAADRMLGQLEHRIGQLREHALLGPARPDIAAEARCLTVGRNLVLYQVDGDGVTIVRVVAGMRDLKTVMP